MDTWPLELEWGVRSPDGRGVHIRRDGELWTAQSSGFTATSRSLDVALIGVIRRDDDVDAHKQVTDYAVWIRQTAASIEGSSPPAG